MKKIVEKKPTPKEKKPKFKFSPKTRKRMSKAHTGKTLSQETKDKISAARQEREALIKMGLLPKFKHSLKTKKHLSRVMKKKKHKPTLVARKKGAKENKNKAIDARLKRKVDRGMFDG